MQVGEGAADRGAVERLDAARPHAGEKADHRRRTAAQLPQRDAVAAVDRQRAGDAVLRQMLHQRDEERQVPRRHPLLVEGQDEIAVRRGEEEIRVLDPLGDALARQHLADVVERDKGAQLVVGDIGIDRHPIPRGDAGLCAAPLSHKVRPA